MCVSLIFGLLLSGQLWGYAAENEGVDPIFQKPSFWEDEPYNRGTLGYKYDWTDPKSSEMKSGIKEGDRIQEYWLPDKRPFEDLDLEAADEYLRHNDTPYALGILCADVKLGKLVVPKGIYQVKLGQWQDGSLNSNIGTLQTALETPPPTATGTHPPSPRKQESPTYQPKALTNKQPPTPKTLAQQKAMQRTVDVFILINMGKVVAVLPIDEKQWIPNASGKKTETIKVPSQGYPPYHQQWGKLTQAELFRARKNETYARPTFKSFAKDDMWLTLEVTQRHWQFRAFVPRAIPAY